MSQRQGNHFSIPLLLIYLPDPEIEKTFRYTHLYKQIAYYTLQSKADYIHRKLQYIHYLSMSEKHLSLSYIPKYLYL